MAVTGQRLLVGRGGIAFVGRPVVFGMVFGEPEHVGIAVGLGEDARRRDGEETPVPLDFAGVRNGMGLEPVSVDQQVLGLLVQSVDGPVHGEVSGLKDVDALDFLDVGPPHTPGTRFRFNGLP